MDAKTWKKVQNEGGEGYNPHDKYMTAEEIKADNNSRLLAMGWTLGITIARRQEWNDAVRAKKITKVTDKINGWGADELKAAVEMHGIK